MAMVARLMFCLGLVAGCLALTPRQPRKSAELILTRGDADRKPGAEPLLDNVVTIIGGNEYGAITDDQMVRAAGVEKKPGDKGGLFGSGLITNFIKEAAPDTHGQKPKGMSKEDTAWWRRMFWYGMFAFFILVGLLVVGGICVITCTSWGRSSFFASSCRAKMEEDLEAKMPQDIKEYVKSAEFRAKCDRLFAEHDPQRTGKVEWKKEFKQELFDEYGDVIKDHKYFKELEDFKIIAVTMDRADFGEVLKWLEYIRVDAASGGIDERMVTTKKKPAEDEESKGKAEETAAVKVPRKQAV